MQFEILGRTLEAWGLPPALEASVRRDWDFPEHRAPATDYHVDLQGGAPERDSWQAHPLRPVVACQERFEVRAATDGFLYEDPHGGLACRHLPGSTFIQVWTEPGQNDPARAMRAALYLAVNEALWCSGLMTLHAAAAGVDGGACAFLGPSGRGKSTTLLRAVQAGWTPVSEDVLWYDPQRRLAYGWERHLRLLPESAALLPPAIAQAKWRVSSDGKVNVPYAALPGGEVWRGGVPLRRLALLERAPTLPSAWLPLSAREAALALWEAAGLPLAQRAREFAAQHIAALQGEAECVRLRLGTTPLPLRPPAVTG